MGICVQYDRYSVSCIAPSAHFWSHCFQFLYPALHALHLDMFNAQESEEATDEGFVGLADEYYPRRTHYLISMPCRMQ